MLADAKAVYTDTFFKALKPPKRLKVSQWAEENRYLVSNTSSEAGRWRNSRTPYLVEIMDCLSLDSPIKKVAVMKGAQVGFTEAGNNWIGYIIDHAPAASLMVLPSLDEAKKISKVRLQPLFDASPCLAAKVSEVKAKDSSNTQLMKVFPGGVLVLTGANSPKGLRSLPAKNAFLDEVDGYPGDVGGEGDPVALVDERQSTYPRRKQLIGSTPTIKGNSRIESAFEESDQRYYRLPCPYCNHYQKLEFKHLKWPKGEPARAHYECQGCKKAIEEHHKTFMLASGRWVSENSEAQPGVAGFHLSSLYSPLGWKSWADIATRWESIQKSKSVEKLKTFVNTTLGETWEEKGEAPEWRRLYERRESYKIGTVPQGVIFLTAACDVQGDRLEVEIMGWGRRKERWSIEHLIFEGDPNTDAPWVHLNSLLMKHWPHSSGLTLPISILGVDSGNNTQRVYDWVRRYPSTKVLALKGQQALPLVSGKPSVVDVKINGKRVRRGVKVWPVGTDHIKTELYGLLRVEKPTEAELKEAGGYPDGFIHFPEHDEEYFKQLTAEEKRKVTNKLGKTKYEWAKVRERNEILDLHVYNRAVAGVFGIDRWTPEKWDQMELMFASHSPILNGTANPQSKAPKKPAKPRRPVDDGSFW